MPCPYRQRAVWSLYLAVIFTVAPLLVAGLAHLRSEINPQPRTVEFHRVDL